MQLSGVNPESVEGNVPLLFLYGLLLREMAVDDLLCWCVNPWGKNCASQIVV